MSLTESHRGDAWLSFSRDRREMRYDVMILLCVIHEECSSANTRRRINNKLAHL